MPIDAGWTQKYLTLLPVSTGLRLMLSSVVKRSTLEACVTLGCRSWTVSVQETISRCERSCKIGDFHVL